ncbi:MAG TPA: 23S rRNA (guanosine(2251)-2'-O)-methyltransferase RlmB [Pyrinomonadaceae bacterium]|nr:23S rRNA (guanosine(2251)-2'-O)-methyltransferase RlmB [Pyrinomonadaceae bacterium]
MTSEGKIYGVAPVLEALSAGKGRVRKVIAADGVSRQRFAEIERAARDQGVPLQKVSRKALSRYVEDEANHQGVVAFVASTEGAGYANADDLLEEISAKVLTDEKPLVVVLDGVEDPRNLGAVLRTVECSGADGVFIPDRRAVGLTDVVAKASAGASEHVKVAQVTNINRLIEDLKSRNVWVIGTSADAKMDYTEWDWTSASALVMGGEGKGLHRLVAENCDVLVKIPLLGKIESLNVSVAAGVVLYEAVRQRAKMVNGE